MNLPRLMMITDGLGDEKTIIQQVETACRIAPELITVQLREKHLTDQQTYSLAKHLSHITLNYRVPLLINERLDIAIACKADGIQLPEKNLSPSSIRQISQDLLIGVSVHSLAAALHAEQEGADYVIFGPIYKTKSKIQYGEPQGITALAEVTRQLKIPVYAVGGITQLNATECLQSGAYGLAAISIFLSNLNETVTDFRRLLATF